MSIGKALAVIAVVTSLAGAQGRGAAKRFTLSGTVVDGAGQPMAGVDVTLQAHLWKPVGDPVTSDAQGRFAFGGLPAGEYILSAEGGFGTARYGTAADPGWVSTVQVGGASGDKSVVFRIAARGMVEGVIRDEFGDPMIRIGVALVRPVWRGGRTTMAYMGQKQTDDRGRYRFGNLAPGSYVVCVASDRQNMWAPTPGPIDYATHVENRTYARTCNRAFQLLPGQHTQVDLTPLSAPTATVRGHVRGLPAQTGCSVNLFSDEEGQGVGPRNYGGFLDANQGAFTISGVPPGHYRLRAQSYSNGNAKSLSAELLLDVGGSDIDGLDLDLAAQGTIDVTFSGVPDDGLQGVGVTVSSIGAGGATYGNFQKKDGVFQVQGVPAGRYRLSVQTPEESCVESVKLGDREMRGAMFEVAAGGALHFAAAISQTCGAVRVRAVRDGAAVPGAKVVLLLSGTPKDPGEMKEDFVNDEGEVSFLGLAPGRYLLWAWAVEGPGAIGGPSSLAAVEQQSTVVEVTRGGAVKVEVPVLAGEGQGQ